MQRQIQPEKRKHGTSPVTSLIDACRAWRSLTHLIVAILIPLFSATADAEIIWSGDFNDGTLLGWNNYPLGGEVKDGPMQLWGCPAYGRAVQYGGQSSIHVGNGDLQWLTSDATTAAADPRYREGPRLGDHALGLHVKSYAGGSVDATSTDPSVVGDWDGSVSTRRRTELRGMPLHYDLGLIPYMSTRWASLSIFVPEDWDDSGSGWGVVTWQWKPERNNGSLGAPPISLQVQNGVWEFHLRTNPNENPDKDSSGWIRHKFSPDLTESIHYPDPVVSTEMLSNLNKGEWTHFVIQMQLDGRASIDGGTGFLKLWMRRGNGDWVQVVNFFPTESYGVLFPMSGDDAYFGFNASLYMENSQVLDLPGAGRTIYYDNVKIGNENANLAMMSHDGSSSEIGSPPKPPPVEVN